MTTQSPPKPVEPALDCPDCCVGVGISPPVSEGEAVRAARRLGALADPTRLRILSLLARHGGHLCVCDLTATFPLGQPTISYHLKVLREAGLVSVERRGLWAYYRVEPPGSRAIEGLSALTAE